jgi:hypothetical protein
MEYQYSSHLPSYNSNSNSNSSSSSSNSNNPAIQQSQSPSFMTGSLHQTQQQPAMYNSSNNPAIQQSQLLSYMTGSLHQTQQQQQPALYNSSNNPAIQQSQPLSYMSSNNPLTVSFRQPPSTTPNPIFRQASTAQQVLVNNPQVTTPLRQPDSRSQTPQQSQMVNYKVYLPDGDIRRFRLEMAARLNTLIARCLTESGLKENSCKIFYQDEELEWIRVTRDDEWKEAMLYYLNKSQLVKLKIKDVKPELGKKSQTPEKKEKKERKKKGENIQNLGEGNLGKDLVPPTNNQPGKGQPTEELIHVWNNEQSGQNPYSEELKQLVNMGFTDGDLNLHLLNQFNGNLNQVITTLIHQKN